LSDDLWREYRRTRERALRDRLIEMHLPLVRYTAQKMLGGLHASVERQDLVSWGTFGLMDAIERFDPDAGTRFSTFATYRIQGSINDEMRKQAWEPKSVRAKSRAVLAAAADLERELGGSPTDVQVATRVGISVEELAKVRREMDIARVGSLSSPTRGNGDDDSSGELGHIIEAVELGDIGYEFAELSASVAEAITHLGQEDRDLMEWVYAQGLPFKEIARILGVTESWVSHLHTRGMVRLQRVLSAKY
jgi:RNA polymerase sigma factor for flagellar operon FliA